MKVALLGRSEMLLRTGELILKRGFSISLIWTRVAHNDDLSMVDSFGELARRAGAVFRSDVGINRHEGVAVLQNTGCEIGLSVNWPSLLSSEVLGSFRYGILNAHAGDLPRYRGNACPNWAILNGEDSIGLCIHSMANELDTGPVLLRDKLPLSYGIYIGEIYEWLLCRVPLLFAEALEKLISGEATYQSQSDTMIEPLRCYPRRPEDGCIDWSSSTEDIWRLVRASSRPFAGAFSFLEGKRRVTIWRADPVSHQGSFSAVPGQVCFALERDPVIACSDGMLRLTEVEMEGEDNPAAIILKSLRNRLQ